MNLISVRQIELLEAAGKILNTQGINGLTTKNLAKEMGFSESAIYRHFRSKEEIILSMLAYIQFKMDENLSSELNKSDKTEKQLVSLLKVQINFFKQHPNYVYAVFSDGLLNENNQLLTAIKKIMETRKKYLTPIINQGINEGLFRNDVSVEELTHLIMGTMRLLMFQWRLSNFEFNIEEKAATKIQSILTLIKK